MYVDVRQPVTGHLLFRFDSERDIIEICDRGVKTVVDLAEYRAPENLTIDWKDNRSGKGPTRESLGEPDVEVDLGGGATLRQWKAPESAQGDCHEQQADGGQ